MKKKLVSVILSITMVYSMLLPAPVMAQTQKIGNTIGGGTLHSVAIKNDGSLWTWGANWSGELANGSMNSNTVPKKVMDGVLSVDAGYWISAIIKNDNSLWMCGSGHLGNGTTTENCVSPIKIMDDVADVSLGSGHNAVIKNDGTLWTWGYNHYGELGNGTTEHSLVPIKIMDDVTDVSLGGHSAAIKKDGSLWLWGNNHFGQLGNGTAEHSSVPIKIMDDVAAVSLGSSHSAAIKKDGSLWLWGSNDNGMLGNGSKENSLVPVKIMDNVAMVSLGVNHSGAIKRDGSLWMWGYNWNGALGNNSNEDSLVPIKVMDDVASVDLGDYHVLAVKRDGTLWAWGANRSGQAGIESLEPAIRVPNLLMYDAMVRDMYTPAPVTKPAQNTALTSFGATVSDWASPEIELAFANKLIPDTLSETDLTQKVNRSEFAAVAIQLYEALSGESAPQATDCDFTDILGDINEEAIKKAYQIDITTGTSKTQYEPLKNINREQLATMLCRVIKKHSDPTWTMETDSQYYMDVTGVPLFEDDADISDWARPSVYFMSKYGIIKGVSNSRFAPKNISYEQELTGYASATREQAIIIAQRIFNNSDMFN